MFNLISILSYVKSIYLEDVSTVVMQQSRYLVFYDRNTSIKLGLYDRVFLFYSCQCFTTEASTWNNRGNILKLQTSPIFPTCI